MKRRLWISMLVALKLFGCGDNEDGLAVFLDPEFRLLRDDLPSPADQGQALSLPAEWGRNGWVADLNALENLHDPSKRMPALGVPRPLIQDMCLVKLNLDPGTRTLEGSAQLTLSASVGDLTELKFNLSAKAVDEVLAQDPEATFSFQNEILTVTPASPIAQGAQWSITIRWHDENVQKEIDFFPEGFNQRLLVGYLGLPSTYFTFGYDFYPRIVQESPVENLLFQVSYPDNLTLVMSGERTSSNDNADGTITDTWAINHPLLSKVSLALGAYKKATGSCGPMGIEIYGLPGLSGDGYPVKPESYVAVVTDICEEFRKLLGDSAFATLRVAGVDERFLNGYSSPGLTLVPNYTLDDDGSGSFPQRDFFIAHEVSHLWFGNEVFAAAAKDSWLIEGLADYLALAFLQTAWGQESARLAWLSEAQILLAYLDQGGRDHPVVPQDSADLEPQIYYLKGAWVFRMLEAVIGNDLVTQALSDIRKNHSFLGTSTEDFVQSAAAASAEDLGWFFDEWLYGTGVISWEPVVQEQAASIILKITQKKGFASNPDRFFQMPVSVHLEEGSLSRDETVTIEGKDSSFELSRP